MSGPQGVRLARLDDAEALAALEARTFAYDRISRASFRRLLRRGRNPLLVVEDAGRLQGYVLLLVRANSRIGRVYGLARAPEAPRGTGHRLLEAALAEARARGLKALHLEVKPDNRSALDLYERAGFEPLALMEGYYDDGGPALRMRLDLKEAT